MEHTKNKCYDKSSLAGCLPCIAHTIPVRISLLTGLKFFVVWIPWPLKNWPSAPMAGLVDTFQAETVAVYQLMKTGRYKEALSVYCWFLPFPEHDIHSKLGQYIKPAATRTGIGSEYVRAPRLVLEGQERATTLKVINDAIATRPHVPDYLHSIKTQHAEKV